MFGTKVWMMAKVLFADKVEEYMRCMINLFDNIFGLHGKKEILGEEAKSRVQMIRMIFCLDSDARKIIATNFQ